MKLLFWVSGIVLALALLFAYRNSRFGVDSPAYRILEASGPFEIREYPSMVLVGTPMGSRDINESSSFMTLFRYISGANEERQKIAMTTPVLRTSESDGTRMSFIVPDEVAASGAPEPTSNDVALETLSAGRYASYRFGGGWEERRTAEAVSRLRDWLRARGVESSAPPVFAYYDPPMMPWFLRRNEVLIRLAEAKESGVRDVSSILGAETPPTVRTRERTSLVWQSSEK